MKESAFMGMSRSSSSLHMTISLNGCFDIQSGSFIGGEHWRMLHFHLALHGKHGRWPYSMLSENSLCAM